MGTGIGCTVYADGVPLADGCNDETTPGAPTVLSGLAISWGRETTVDQPDASTCTFSVLDELGDSAFTDRLRTGTRIDVTATGTIYPDPDTPVWPDPGFDTGVLPGVRTTNATASIQTIEAQPAGSVRRNLVPNPNFAASISTGWYNLFGATRALDTEDYHSAPSSCRFTRGSTGQRAQGAYSNSLGLATTGEVWRWSYWAKAAEGVVYYSSLRGATGTGQQPETGTGEWVFHEYVVTIPQDSNGSVSIEIAMPTASTVEGDQLWIDDVLVEKVEDLGNTPTGPDSYFDGATPDTAETDYAWTGAANNSASTASPVAVPDEHGNVVRVETTDSAKRTGVILAPAAFVPAGTDPGAWDEIQATAYGQTWTYGADVLAPPGSTVTIKPVLFSGPYQGAYTVINKPLSVAGDGAWHTLTAAFVPNASGAWVGIQVTYFPTGPAWDAMPPAMTWDDVPPLAWDDYGALLIDNVTVNAPDEDAPSTVLVYSGRVVSLKAEYDEGAQAPIVSVSCVDFTADLENVSVGDEPWPVEPMGDRFQRILTLAGADVDADIAPTAAGIDVSWRDVDSQGATGLLAELATSVDAVMWSAVHTVTGPYFRVEDPATRPSQLVLALVDGVVTVIANPSSPDALLLSACDVLRDDVEWSQDVQDVMTRAAVQWKEQGVDDDGKPTTTDRTVTVIDAPLEAEVGVRRISVTTELQAADDARAVAERILARTSAQDWRASGLVIDDLALDDATEEDVTRLLTLLDGTSRNGLPITLTDLPWWAPVPGTIGVYLEGGEYEFVGGAWLLDLTVSNATGQGASAEWDELDPTWTWDQWDPAITWDDLRGAGPPTTTTIGRT